MPKDPAKSQMTPTADTAFMAVGPGGLYAKVIGSDMLTWIAASAGAVPDTRQIIAGAGLTGGGTLAADRTLNVAAADGSITVNADSIQVAYSASTPASVAAAGSAGAAATAARSDHAHTIGTNVVTDAMLRQGAARTVIGRASSTTGNVADIAATGSSDAVLRESGGAIAFGTVATAGIANDAVTDAKLRNSGALSVIGRSANSSGDPADISASAASGAVLRESGSSIAFGTVATAGLAANAVTDAKLRQSAGVSVVGRSANSTGDVADITASADDRVLARSSGALSFVQVTLAMIASAVQSAAQGTESLRKIYTSTPAAIGTASAGSSVQAAAGDHVHAHGSQTDGSHHAAATTSVNGFMAAADKTQLAAFDCGTYVCTYTNVSGVTSFGTAQVHYYTLVAKADGTKVVTVYGARQITTSASGVIQYRVSLPVAATISDTTKARGQVSSGSADYIAGVCFGSSGTNDVTVSIRYGAAVTADTVNWSFMYVV